MARRKRNLPSSNTLQGVERISLGSRLAWGPGKMPSADQVNVQVEDGLPGSWTYIEHRTVAIFDRSLAGNLGCHQVTATDYLGILRSRLLETSNMFLGHNQHMRRTLRMKVLKGKRMLVFVDFLGRKLTLDDAAEQTVCHGSQCTA